jgi:hypothetical protein
MSTPVIVVGAGPSGLGCALALASALPVVVVERIPVLGGTAGWDHPSLRACAERAADLGVTFRLGESALRWDGRSLLITGPGTCATLNAEHLFYAGGLRPATAAALKLTGDRPAGILPATVVEHLLQAGVPLWRTVVVIGEGHWAGTIARKARRLGSAGRDRVTAIRLVYDDPSGQRQLELACDGIVLAEQPVPNRNIDGAVLTGAQDVTYVQPLTPTGFQARFDDAQRVASAWLETHRKVDAR